jgi:hypothetical protein
VWVCSISRTTAVFWLACFSPWLLLLLLLFISCILEQLLHWLQCLASLWDVRPGNPLLLLGQQPSLLLLLLLLGSDFNTSTGALAACLPAAAVEDVSCRLLWVKL